MTKSGLTVAKRGGESGSGKGAYIFSIKDTISVLPTAAALNSLILSNSRGSWLESAMDACPPGGREKGRNPRNG